MKQNVDLKSSGREIITPLYCVIQKGHQQAVDFLLHRGAEHKESLFFAIEHGQLEIIKQLIEYKRQQGALKAFIEYRNDKDETVLQLATANDRHDMKQWPFADWNEQPSKSEDAESVNFSV